VTPLSYLPHLKTRPLVEAEMARTGNRLHKSFHGGAARFSVGHAIVDPALAKELIAAGIIVPAGDGLFDDSQTYMLRRRGAA
jgi:hypothetical protein